VLKVFAVTLALYLAGFWAVQHLRQRRGPWELTFATTTNGAPSVTIQQAHLGIRDVRLEITGTNLPGPVDPAVIRFLDPDTKARLPFGEQVFLDTTFLPGTVTLELFGNEIELLPRVLIVNKEERPWQSGATVELSVREPDVGDEE
jgi:hypothetical protein